jgi:L,D-transpeptidase ErfK/SrfK
VSRQPDSPADRRKPLAWASRGAALLGLVAGLVALASCALIGSRPIAKPAPEIEAAPPPPEPQLAPPVDTHMFTLGNPDDDVVGAVQITLASKEDTLPDIARRFNVGYEEIARANPGVDPWLPGAGRSIVVPTRFVLPDAPRDGIVINVAAMRLYYFPPHKKGEPQVVYTHPIGIGKVGWSTPQGVTSVVSHVKDPVWRPSPALRKDHFNDNGEALPAVVMPGPDNPLGKFELTLGWRGFLIHGTNKPYGVGLRSSHGCIRLYPEDIEKIYAMVTNGTHVRVVNQPFLFGMHEQQLYLQAYSVLEDDPRDWDHAQKKLLSHALAAHIQKTLQESGSQMDWQSVAAITHAPRGIPVPVTGAGNSIDAVLSAAPMVENRIPAGADWDGTDDTGTDGQSAKQLLLERQPTTAQAPAPRAPGT